MDYFKNKFLSEIGRLELEEKGKYVCGDCKYFGKKKCPINVKYKIAPVCFFFKRSKKQMKSKRDKSVTMYETKKKKMKHKLSNENESKRIFTRDGFVKCNLRFGFKVRSFLDGMIEKEKWKCERRRCENKQKFVVRAKHPTRQVKISEQLIYKITDTYIEFKLACPGCNFLHRFPTDLSREIRSYIKSLDDEKVFINPPETTEEAMMMTKYVSQLAFPDGFENDPLTSMYRGTIAYKAFRRRIKKVAKENEIKPKKIIGLIFNRSKGCLVLDDADFVVIPGSIFNFGVA